MLPQASNECRCYRLPYEKEKRRGRRRGKWRGGGVTAVVAVELARVGKGARGARPPPRRMEGRLRVGKTDQREFNGRGGI